MTKLLFIVTIICIVSCRSISKIVYQTKVTDSQFKYYVTEKPNYRKGEGKFYARVDSGNVRISYSFQPNNIYKTYDNVGNYVFTLVFEKHPMLGLTSIDSIVLTKANNLLDSLVSNNLKLSIFWQDIFYYSLKNFVGKGSKGKIKNSTFSFSSFLVLACPG